MSRRATAILLNAFSISSEHLAHVVEEDYETNPGRIRVIPTGVDAEGEFNPVRVQPVEMVQRHHFNILFPGRLAEQKDPLLMVDVIRRVVDVHGEVRVHVVGDGPLEHDVRAFVRQVGLERHFAFHPPSRELARWYAACDLLLMTSVFEGIPYVVYEAMAMELPIVAPSLPGNVELMADTAGILIDPRDDVSAYAGAVNGLIEDSARAEALGRAARARVLECFSLRSMGDMHAQLYDDLLERRRSAALTKNPPPTKSMQASLTREGDASLHFLTRPIRGQPLVSVVVPCFNHGRFLPQCIDAVLDQDYEEIEVIVVDDASTDPATIRVLGEVELRDGVRVIRQLHNLGPSIARNRAIKEARGRYILPVDADNILLPKAVASLVAQLQSAGELVGYIYPNCQFFGTRDDYYQPPSFNLDLLLRGNYCDTCSLIDRDIFDAGLFYAEDIRLGHEDWDFALTLATHGVRGEPANSKTLLFRKHGFTRSDTVEYAGSSFHEEILDRHPELYGGSTSLGRFGRWHGPAAEIKAQHAPGLSIIMTTAVNFSTEAGEHLLRRLAAQSCHDAELIVECPASPDPPCSTLIRRIPPGLCANQVERLCEALRLVRASHVLLAGDELTELLAEQPFIERLQRTFWANPSLEGIAFVDGGERGRFPYRLLENHEISQFAHALAWTVDAQSKLPDSLLVSEGMVVESITQAMDSNKVELQWRHAVAYSPPVSTGEEAWLNLAQREDRADAHRRTERKMTATLKPALPALPYDAVRRWLGAISWLPPETELLTRHRELGSERRIIRRGRLSPPGFVLEYDLGAIQRFAPPGTVRLIQSASSIRTVPRGSPRAEEDEELGHLELSALPLLQAVERAVLPDGSETLVAGELDGLRSVATSLEFLGYIEAFPNKPTFPPHATRPCHGMVGLLRCMDWTARKHVYRIGSAWPDEMVGELGGLHLTREPGSIPLWIDKSGRVVTEQCLPEIDPPYVGQLLRWTLAPLAWRGFGHVRGRARAVVRRGLEGMRTLLAKRREASAYDDDEPHVAKFSRMNMQPLGYLYAEAAPGRLELFAAIHPVTGDQLLTHHVLEAADMGYGITVSLGYVVDQAPVTGTLTMRRVSVPWASRFGLEVRRH